MSKTPRITGDDLRVLIATGRADRPVVTYGGFDALIDALDDSDYEVFDANTDSLEGIGQHRVAVISNMDAALTEIYKTRNEGAIEKKVGAIFGPILADAPFQIFIARNPVAGPLPALINRRCLHVVVE